MKAGKVLLCLGLLLLWGDYYAIIVNSKSLENNGHPSSSDERANLATFIQWAAQQDTNTSSQALETPTTTTTPIIIVGGQAAERTTPPPPQDSLNAIILTPEVGQGQGETEKQETIYVIRQPVSGSISGIIREALGLVHNTLYFVGVNLLGGPLLVTTNANARLNASNVVKIIGRNSSGAL